MANRDLLRNGVGDAVWLDTATNTYQGWDSLASPTPFAGVFGYFDVATNSFEGTFVGFRNVGTGAKLSAVFDNADPPVLTNQGQANQTETVTDHVSGESPAGIVPLFDYTGLSTTGRNANVTGYSQIPEGAR